MNAANDYKSLLFAAVGIGVLTLAASFILDGSMDARQRITARGVLSSPGETDAAAVPYLTEPPGTHPAFAVPIDPIQVLLGIGMAALAILIALDLRLGVAVPPAFVEEFTDQVNRRHYKEVYELCRDHPSFLARVLMAGMGRLQYGLDEARKSAADTVECIRSLKKQANNQLLTLAILAPTLGLASGGLNLVLGLSKVSPGSMSAAQWSVIVTEAVSPVVAGLFLLSVGLTGYAVLSDRLSQITLDSARIADDLLTQMYHNSRRPGGSEPPYWKGWKPSTL